ncbi:tRNA threonylcarbamoyladenosine biosynthesis protein RimN [Marinomonas sp. 42_23_T18]|nr:tRNA threonylcarbamoyladenosine biosynthesis protein RimN [Marinomonas sp. 42_23_T18]
MIITSDPFIITDILNKGGIIAYPTEAVWGLGCDPKNQAAVIKLLNIKSRPMSKGMILVAGDDTHLAPWLKHLPITLQTKLLASYDSPTSWIVADQNISPNWIRGDHQSIALRLSQHTGVQALCQAFNGCIVSTSANPAGLAPALNMRQVLNYFNGQIDAVFDSPLGQAKQPSQIKNLLDDQLIRQ